MPTGRAMPVRGISREKAWFRELRKKSVYLKTDSIPKFSTTAAAVTSWAWALFQHSTSRRPAVKLMTMEAIISSTYTGSPKA